MISYKIKFPLGVAICGYLIYKFYRWKYGKIPVIIITDIGRDPDDTLALYTAYAAKRFSIIAIVTTGGNTINRARLVRRLLNQMEVPKQETVLVADMSQGNALTNICFIPEDTPSVEDTHLMLEVCAEDLILKIARKYTKHLGIFCIAPLTPLAKACDKDPIALKHIKFLAIQGQLIDKGTDIEADMESFNLREDENATNTVFCSLQKHVPFHMLGKHAAYAVPLHKQNIAAIPNILHEVEHTMDGFRRQNPQLFWSLYPVEECKRENWFDEVHHVCTPYDPLLFLSFIHPEMFTRKHHGQHTTIGNDADVSGISHPELVRQKLQYYTNSFFIK